MRKRTMSAIADHLYWLLVALLPLLCYFIQFLSYELTSVTDSLPTFLTYMKSFGISTDSVIYSVLNDLFGANGILPMFSVGSNAVLLYLSYFVMDADSMDNLTLLAGEDLSQDAFDALVELIEEAYPDLEIEAQRGEQPLYPLVLSLE